MVKILLVCVGLFFLCNVEADLQGNCYLDGVSSNQWKTFYINQPIDNAKRTIFKEFSIQHVTSVEVQGIDYEQYFRAELKDEKLLISPSSEFENYQLNEIDVFYPKMNVNLIFNCQDGGTAKLAFYQPINDLNTTSNEVDEKTSLLSNTQFKSIYYMATYKAEGVLHSVMVHGTMELENSDRFRSIELLDHIDNFGLLSTPTGFTIVVNTNLPPEVLEKDVVVLLTIEAYSENAVGPGRTVIVVYLPPKYCLEPTTPSLQFEQDYYSFETITAYKGILGFVRAVAEPLDLITYSLEGSTVLESLVTLTDTGLLLATKEIPVGVYNSKVYAETEYSKLRTETIVALKVTMGENVTKPTLNFEKDIYSLQTNDKFKGLLGVVVAIAEPLDVITYSLEVSTGIEGLEIAPNTGFLKVWKEIPAGDYSTKVYAKTKNSKIKHEAIVALKVVKRDDVIKPTLYFETEIYRLQTNDKFKGLLGVVVAISEPLDVITYSLEASTGIEELEIEPNTGFLKVSKKIPAGDYTTKVYAKTKYSKLKHEATVTLKVVKRENVTEPTLNFEKDIYSLQTNDKFKGLLGMVVATAEPSDVITYTLGSSNSIYELKIAPDTGFLNVWKEISAGDYITKVYAKTKSSNLIREATLALKVVKRDYVIKPTLNFETEIYRLQTNDKFKGLLGVVVAISEPLDVITYSLEASTGIEGLEIAPDNGLLKVSKEIAVGYYSTKVYAETKNSKLKHEATVALKVVKRDDVIKPTLYFEKEIYRLQTSDKFMGLLGVVVAISEPLDVITYSLETSTGIEGLEIVPDNGLLKVSKEIAVGDYSTKVYAETKNSKLKHEATVALRVIKREDVTKPTLNFKMNSYSFQMNDKFMGLLGVVVAISEPLDVITYSLEASTEIEGLEIAPDIGLLKVSKEIPFGNYSIKVYAETKNRKLKDEAIVTIIVNMAWSPKPPSLIFDKESYVFDTNTQYSGILGLVRAVAYPLETIEYYLLDVPDLVELELNPSTGVLKLLKQLPVGDNYVSVQALGVVSKLTVQARVQIRVVEVMSPNPPSLNFDKETYVFYMNTEYLGVLGLVRAVAIPLDAIEYFLVDNSHIRELDIHKNTGVVTVKEKLKPGVYSVRVYAKIPTVLLTDEATVTIKVIEAEDPKPSLAFEQEMYAFETNNMFEGILGLVRAVAVPLDKIEYSLDYTSYLEGLAIDKSTGLLKTTKKLALGNYRTIVYALAANSKLQREAIVAIKVVEVEYPIKPTLEFETWIYPFETNTMFEGILGLVRAVAVPLDEIEYSLDYTSYLEGLAINKSTGLLKVTKKLPLGEYRTIVYALAANSKLEREAIVTIKVALAEDPTKPWLDFEKVIYTFNTHTMFEGILGLVRAVAVPLDEIEYSLDYTSHPEGLEIDDSGLLNVTKKLSAGEYITEVYALAANSKLKRAVTLKVNVVTVEDPTIPTLNFERDYYFFETNSAFKGILGLVRAVAVPLDKIEYLLEDTYRTEGLEVDESTGLLKVTKKLPTGEYSVKVYALAATSQLRVEATVIIKVIKVEDPMNQSLKFDKDVYHFETNTMYCGILGLVQAVAVPLEEIEYCLLGTMHPEGLLIENNTGLLKISKKLLAGNYVISVQALGLTSQLETQSTVTIKVVAVENPKPSLEFDKDNYSFEINTVYQGIVGFVRAVAVPLEEIEYTLLGTSYPKGLEIDKITGRLKTTRKLSAGNYSTSVHAFGLTSKLQTQATVTIKVVGVESPKPSLKFDKDIYHFEANTVYQGILGLVRAIAVPLEEIEYSLLGTSQPEGLEIDKITGHVKTTKKLLAGEYSTSVRAFGFTSKLETQATVIIRVFSIEYPTSSLKFGEDIYRFKTNTVYQGILGVIRAVAVPLEVIEYSLLHASSTSHPKGLEIDKRSGLLKVTKKLSAGDYSTSVQALGLTSKLETQAIVTISVVAVKNPMPWLKVDNDNYPFKMNISYQNVLGLVRALPFP